MANAIHSGATALIYCDSGGGKTYNAIRTPGKKILLSSDRSYQFAARGVSDLEIWDITRWLKDKTGKERCFSEQFDAAVAKKPATIIIDNLSDLMDMAVLELIGSDGASKDNRQSYQAVYMAIRRLARQANFVGCNVLFTAWAETTELVTATGEPFQSTRPKLPSKIINNVAGLCNLVGHIETGERDGKKLWFYNLTPSQFVMAKDQIWGRPSCFPQQLFTPPQTKK